MNDTAHAPSYYAATATAYAPFPVAQGAYSVDVVVIGGGYTGLSAAIHLRERGFSVALLEAAQIGWGASGRNGGQIIPGLRKGASDLVRMFGREKARALFNLSLDAIKTLDDLISQNNISCDHKKTGHFLAATKLRDLHWMEREAACLQNDMGYSAASMVTAQETENIVRGTKYHGGLLDRGGGHLHPLNFVIGLAKAASTAGAMLFESSRVTKVTDEGVPHVSTSDAEFNCNHVIFACDAYLGDLNNQLAARIMPVGNYLIATEPLPNASALLPADMPISDSNFVLDYYRLSADKRLIFSGGEKYTAMPPGDIKSFVKPHLLKLFSQLTNVKIEYAWGGMVSVTTSRLPHIGKNKNLFFAQGYSGQGVAMATLAGKLIAEAVSGTAERFDIFARTPPSTFPGGTLFRSPLYILAMLWYALRDRL